MVKLKPQYIVLYFIGIFLLLFGNKQFFDKIQKNEEGKLKQRKLAEVAEAQRNKKFEIQELTYDSIQKSLKNNNISFQTVIVQANFSSKNATKKITNIETNDDENASDSL